MTALSAGQDVVVNATRPAPGHERDHPAITRSLLSGLAHTDDVRLIVIGGAGSLTVPGTEGRLAIDDPRYVPAPWRHIAEASNAQYEALHTADTRVAWTYISPSALFEPGTRTGSTASARTNSWWTRTATRPSPWRTWRWRSWTKRNPRPTTAPASQWATEPPSPLHVNG